MSKNLELKKQVVSEVTKKFQNAKSVMFVHYSGMTVEQVTDLRAQLRANDVEYCVLKNTLVRRALQDLKIEGFDEILNGPSAFAFGLSDPVSPAKVINDYIKKTKTEAISIKAGLLGTEQMTAAQVTELATIPSREMLLSRLVGSLQSGIASFARVIDAVAKKNAEGTAEAAPAVEA